MEDLSKFILVGREKLTSVKAEIRAIEKLHLAEEVRNQKRIETQMLAEALLDAEVKIGDLIKQIPKATTNNPAGKNQHSRGQNDSGVDLTTKEKEYQYKSARDTAIAPKMKDTQMGGKKDTLTSIPIQESPKTKKEVIEGLGFTVKQAERFETLAENKDVVEQVKAEVRENDDLPTRTRVINLVEWQKKMAGEKLRDSDKKVDLGKKTHAQLDKITASAIYYHPDRENMDAMFMLYMGDNRKIEDEIKSIDRALSTNYK